MMRVEWITSTQISMCSRYIPKSLEVKVKKNMLVSFFYNYIFRIRTSLSLNLVCGKIRMLIILLF